MKWSVYDAPSVVSAAGHGGNCMHNSVCILTSLVDTLLYKACHGQQFELQRIMVSNTFR